MKHLFILLACLITFSCTKSKVVSANSLEIVFYNNQIFSYSKNSTKDTINIIRYSLKNNSNQIYFINNIIKSPELQKTMLKKNGINMSIYDKKNIEVKYFQPTICDFDSKSVDNALDYLEGISLEEKRLGYKHSIEYFKNSERDELFFIHPNEILLVVDALTGQDIVTVGIGGALMSGVLTTSAITKSNMINEIVKSAKN